VAIVLSVLLQFTASDYPFGILWPLCCLSFFGLRTQWPQDNKGVIRCRKPKKDRQYNGQDTKGVIRSRVLVMFVLLHLKFHMSCFFSDRCPFVIFLLAIVLSVLLRFTASDYPFGILALVLSVLLRFTASDYPFFILIQWPQDTKG
jgi:hypothetical protein